MVSKPNGKSLKKGRDSWFRKFPVFFFFFLVWAYHISWTFLVLFPFFYIHGRLETPCEKEAHILLFRLEEFWGWVEAGQSEQTLPEAGVALVFPQAAGSPDLPALSSAKAPRMTDALGAQPDGHRIANGPRETSGVPRDSNDISTELSGFCRPCGCPDFLGSSFLCLL